jgi:hypothetical protein
MYIIKELRIDVTRAIKGMRCAVVSMYAGAIC